MSSSVVHLPKTLDVLAKIEGGLPLAAVLCNPKKTKRVSDLTVRLKGESKKSYNLAHFYNYYTKRFNISKRFSISTVGFYGVLGCLFVGDRSVKALLESLPATELAQLGQAATAAPAPAPAPVVNEMASFEAAVHKQMVSGSAAAAVAPTATAEPITEASLTAAVMVALEKQVRAALVEALQPTTTATATATEDEETEEEKLCAIDEYLDGKAAEATATTPRFKPVNPFGDNDKPYTPTSVPLPPFPSIPKEERDKESAQLKDLALGDTEVLIASKRDTKAVTLKADGTFRYDKLSLHHMKEQENGVWTPEFHITATFDSLHSSELLWHFNEEFFGNKILRKPLEHIYCGVYTLAAHLQHKDKTLPVVPVAPIKPRVTQEMRDLESGLLKELLGTQTRRLEVRYKDTVMSTCCLETNGKFTFVDHNEAYYLDLCASELIWHFNERLFRLGAEYDPILPTKSLSNPLDHIYFVASPRLSLGKFLEADADVTLTTLTSTSEAAATSTSEPAALPTGEHQADCHCYAFPDEDYDDYDEEVEPLLHVLSIPEPVRSQEIQVLRWFAHDCDSTKVYVMNNMVADITLEYDGTFTLHKQSQQPIADLNSLEVLYLLSSRTTADRELFETRARSDPTYALDQFTFASNPWKSLAVLVAEKEDQVAVAASTSTSTSATATATATATVSPQTLLQQEKAKEVELRAEIELWRAVRAQQQINKDLEKQLAALKELV